MIYSFIFFIADEPSKSSDKGIHLGGDLEEMDEGVKQSVEDDGKLWSYPAA